jgi:hypothetical protein
MQNLDLFPALLPAAVPAGPRAKPRVLMNVSDAGEREDGQQLCVMTCRRCGAVTDWLPFATMTEAKRGIPCEACNAATPA